MADFPEQTVKPGRQYAYSDEKNPDVNFTPDMVDWFNHL